MWGMLAQIPASGLDYAQAGYNRYHCYPYAQILDLESKFYFDKAHGIESAVVIYGSDDPPSRMAIASKFMHASM